MPTAPLPNYLRTYRRRHGLTQSEVAALLGTRDVAAISLYESAQRVLLLPTALAYEAIFGVPVGELFAGELRTAQDAVRRRAGTLAARIQQQPATPWTPRKLERLTLLAQAPTAPRA